MNGPKHHGIPVAPILGLLLLASCQHLDRISPPADPEVRRLNGEIRSDAAGFYAALGAKAAPECGVEGNRAGYAALRQKAQALQARAAATPGDTPLTRAAASLGGVIDAAERAHERASANTADRFGICMAPTAITLNADAVARATKSIDDLQTARSN